jgi:hypothetical protein
MLHVAVLNGRAAKCWARPFSGVKSFLFFSSGQRLRDNEPAMPEPL